MSVDNKMYVKYFKLGEFIGCSTAVIHMNLKCAEHQLLKNLDSSIQQYTDDIAKELNHNRDLLKEIKEIAIEHDTDEMRAFSDFAERECLRLEEFALEINKFKDIK